MSTNPLLFKFAEAYGAEFSRHVSPIVGSLPRAPWGIIPAYSADAPPIQVFPDIRVTFCDGSNGLLVESSMDELSARIQPLGIDFDRSTFDKINGRDMKELDASLKDGTFDGHVGIYSSRPSKGTSLFKTNTRSYRITAVQFLEVLHNNGYLVLGWDGFNLSPIPPASPEKLVSDIPYFLNVCAFTSFSGDVPKELFVRVVKGWS